MSEQVVALGAWVDLVPSEEAEARGATPGGAHFRVHEFAILGDGRRVTIRDDLGWSSWSRIYDPDSGRKQQADPWRHLTREEVEDTVRRTIVIPDDDDDVDEHPYEWLRELLLGQGIDVTVDRLRAVPYTVEFSERLDRRLRDQPPSDGD